MPPNAPRVCHLSGFVCYIAGFAIRLAARNDIIRPFDALAPGISSLNPQLFFTSRKVVFLLASLSCLLWGSAYPAIKTGYAMFAIASDDIPTKLLFAGYRFFFAGILLLAMAILTRRDIFILNLTRLRQVTLPLRQNSCRLLTIGIWGGDKGQEWQGTDRDSWTEQ